MLFIDMDGVIAQYEPKDYLNRPFPFETPDSHYFLHRECVETVKIALHEAHVHPIPFVFLSTVSAPSIADPNRHLNTCHAQRLDKIQWLERHGFDLTSHPLLTAIAGHTPKPEAAIKFHNSINSPSTAYETISVHTSPHDLFSQLISL